ncbi:hypothetical protein L1286_07195 [Pseudoalteromonas sp. SMS1]|uniref:alpha/beta hydrolase family protein n=1 Tax=Pseudoalteromonas sp. SMS1 TaxID=2908894 RepID=UPI001F197189|nr:hypothetical protein [Pseudoalteromonas sp. SMS1]MCF2857248.1 hypothetical protein [Pseudoalteromonas sp. SMS1]
MILIKRKLWPVVVFVQVLGACSNDTEQSVQMNQLDTKKESRTHQHHYPQPTGNFNVGVKTFDIASYQEDRVSPVLGVLRNLHITVFYPSDTLNQNYHPYFDKWGKQAAYLEGLRPADAPNHPEQHQLSDMSSWSILDAPIAQHERTGWPVLFYSHGLGLFETDNRELLETLASHGFVVVAINHTYLAGVTTFNTGKSTHLYLPEEQQDVTTPLGRTYFDTTVAAQIGQDVQLTHEWLLWHQWHLDHQIDLRNIGTLGFSLGGSAAMNGCQLIAYCIAAANMDGIVLGTVAQQPLNKPLLLLSASTPFSQLNSTFTANQAETHLVTIIGSEHNDFTDQNRWIVGYPSAVNPDVMHQIVKESMTTFFKAHLTNQSFVLPQRHGVHIISK